jgi:hypothetical protein
MCPVLVIIGDKQIPHLGSIPRKEDVNERQDTMGWRRQRDIQRKKEKKREEKGGSY